MNDSFTLNLPPRGKHLTVLLSMFAALFNVLYAQNSVAIRTVATAQLCNSTTTYVLYLPPLYGSSLSAYYTISGGSFIEYDNGTAVFTGTATNSANSNARWTINVTLGGRTYSPPSGSPKAHSCLSYSTSDWYYYTTTTGTLTGVSSLAGKTLSVTRTGPAFQVGTGANVQDALFGASGWFNYTSTGNCTYYSSNIASSGSGDFNFRLSGAKLPSSCNNVTSAGSIGANESLCGSYDPAAISSLSLPAGGGTGTIEYVWLQTTDPNTAAGTAYNYTQIAGATSSTYNPPVITQTTWYRRCARRQGCVNYAGESNWVRKEVINNCNSTINTCTGVFYDTGGSVCPYSDNQNYTTTYCSNNGGQIKFTFTSFNVEQGYDFLYVYNGNSTSSPLIGTYTGTTLPAAITSTNGCLTIKFTSDNSVTAAGWAATISCLAATTCSNVTTAGSIGSNESVCGTFNPALINSIALPTGGTGTLEYVWLRTTDAATAAGSGTNYTQITGATAATYDPPSISTTTWYRRCARRSGCTQYVGESNWVKKEVKSQPVLTPWVNVNNAGWTNGTTATLCSGGTVSLGPNTYTQTGVTGNWAWTGPNGYTFSTTNNGQSTPVISNIQTSQAGTYTAVFTATNGCTASVSFTISVTTCTSCQNVTSAGSIGTDEGFCGTSFDPALINSIALPTGGTGTLEYVWLQTTDPATAAGTAYNYTQIVGANGATYDPGVISVTTWFRRCARRSGCTQYAGESNWVKKEIKSLPNATVCANATVACNGTIYLSAGGGTSYSWAGPGGYTSTLQNPTRTGATAAMSGVYTVTVTGSNGCTAVKTTTVTVNCVNPTPTCTGNLVLNSGFENGTTSWVNWGSFTVVASPYSGSSAANVYNTTAGGGAGQIITATAGTTYTLVGYGKKTGTQWGGFGFKFLNSSSVQIGTDYSLSVTTTSYQSYTQSITAPTGTAYIQVYIWKDNGTGTLNVDDLCLTASITCSNVTSAGSIGSDESICGTSLDPALINSIALPTGGTGTLEYVWLMTTDPATAAGTAFNYTQIANTNSATYDPGVISVTTWYRRCARRSGCTQYVGESNWVKKEVKPKPTATATSNSPINCGSAISLTATGGGTYAWTGPNAFTSTSATPSIANSTVAMAGTYSVTVMAANGCTATASTSVTLNNCTPPPPTTCTTYTVANASGCTPGTYAFYLNGQNYTVQSGTFTDNANGTATLVATYAQVSVPTNIVSVNVTFTGRTTTAPVNSPKYGLCINSGGSSWYYFTAFTGTMTQGATVTNISQYGPAFQVGNGANLNNTSFGAAAWFQNTATGASIGDFNFSLINATACPTCQNVTSAGSIGSDESICGTSLDPALINSIALPAGGVGTLEYVWLMTTDPTTAAGTTFNYTQIAGATGATYDPGVISVTTWYRRCARRSGCTQYVGESNWVKKEVKTAPILTPWLSINGATAINTNTATLCKGGAVTLCPAAQTGVVGNWSWTGPNGFTFTTTNNNQSVIPFTNIQTAQAGTYTAVFTATNGCTVTISMTINVNSVTATATGNAPCIGATISLTATGGGTYSWSGPNGFTSNLAAPSIANATTAMGGTYTVTVTGTNGCTGTASVAVVVNTCCQNVTSAGSIGSDESICGTSLDPALINSIALPTGGTGTLEYVWLMTTDPTTAAGTTFNYTQIAGANGATYDPGVISVTTWYRRCARRSGCTQYVGESNWVKKEVKAVPTVTASNSGSLCAGQTLTLSATGSTTGTYAWTGPNGYTSTSQNPTLTGVAAAGTYTVTFTASNGCTATASTTVIATCGSIGDFVWNDLDGDGIQDAGEPGIQGVTVTLTGPNGTTTVTTDANGSYTFTNLPAGNYTVTFGTPTGFTASPANQGGDPALDSNPVGGVATVTLGAGQTNTTIDAGFQSTQLTIGNYVWYDQDNNGTQDASETGVSNATVNLYLDANNDNVPDGAALATTTTNGAGNYTFTNLTPANYIVGVVLPSGYASSTTTATSAIPNNDNNTDNNGVNTVSGELRSNAITLVTGTEPTTDGDGSNGNLTLDFGLTGTASIGDFVWNDVNGNGIQDGGELGVQGVTVTLYNSANVVVATVTTATNGSYLFPNLLPDTYTVGFSNLPAGFTIAPQGQGGNNNVDSDPNPATGITAPFVLGAGQNITNIDAGLNQCGNVVISAPAFCQGDTVLLTANLTGTGYTYQWYFNGNIINGATNVSYEVAVGGNYKVIVTLGSCITSSNTVAITMYPAPTATASSNSPVCATTPLNLMATGGGTYTWAGPNGFTSALQNPSFANATSVMSGTYSVTVTNANGCTASATTSVTVFGNVTNPGQINNAQSNCGPFDPAPITSVSLPTPSTGLEYVWLITTDAATAAGAAYNYVEIPGANGSTYDPGMISQTTWYRRCARVAGCIQYVGESNWVKMEVFPTPSVTASGNDVACNGGTTTITAIATNGTPTYEYSLDGGVYQSSNTFTVGMGTYTVTVKDANNCTSSTSVTITEPSVLSAASSASAILCNGENSTVIVTAIGGTAPYTGTGTFTVNAGTYTYTVTDANGCSTTTTVTVGEPSVLSALIAPVAAVCTGQSTASVNLTVSGGTSPYTYLWSNGAITEDLVNVGAGTYDVVTTDANGCTASATVTVGSTCCNVTNPGSIGFDESNCGSFDPTLITSIALPSGGFGTLEYVWLITTDAATAAGTAYNYVEIPGANGPTYDPGTISQTTWYRRCARRNGCTQYVGETNWVKKQVNPVPSVTASGNDVACNGGTTTITATATNGTPAYEYSLDGGAYQSSNTFTVGMGTYTVTVKDANNCTSSTSVTISQPTVLSASSNATAILCNGGSSTVTVTATGGTAPYTGTGTFTVNAGTYTYTVTDANGCSTTTSVTITEPSALSAASSATSILCNGGSSTVTVTATGGTAPYTGTGTFTVTAGTYTYTVTDANGCSTTTSVTISEPSALSAASNATAILCNGGYSTVTVTATGGTAPYTGTGTFTVNAGTYTYTVTDANGCSTTTTVTVGEPSVLSASIAPVAAVCTGQATASVNLTVNGGTSPYTYLWANGATTEDLTNVGAGTYDVVVTDANGCTTSATITVGSTCCNVTNPGSIGFDESNCGSFDPALITSIALPSGGFGTLEYVWLITTDAATAAGTAYNYVEIPGANGPTYDPGTISQTTWYRRCARRNGCTQYVGETNWVKKQVNPVPSVTASGNDVACNGGTTTITATATNGTPAYEYSLDGGAYQSSNTFTVGMGTYTVTVKDANNCTSSTSVTISQPTVLSASSNATAILCNGGSSTVTVTATGGTAPYTGTGTFTVNAGTYTYTVTDANGCSTTTSVTITEPSALSAASSATSILCNGGSSTVTVTATGGTAPYTGTGTFTVTAGTYTYTVTDANGCSTTTSVTISEPSALSAASNATAILCNGGSSTVTVTATGGTAPYTGTGTFTVNAGTYTYTVTDANGCSTTTTVTVGEPSVLSASIAPVAAVCTGQATASVNLTVNGGTSPYTYLWANGATTEDLTNVGAGTYDVVVTDANGCTTSATITVGSTCCNVTNPGSIGFDESNCGSFDPALITSIAFPSGGFGTLEYVWLITTDAATAAGTAYNYVEIPGANGPTYDPGTISQTTWYRRCARRNGCTQYVGETNWVKKQVNPVPSVTASGNDVACNGGTTTITATATNGTPAYEYSLDGGAYQSSNTFTVGMGTYTVTVKDANNCTSSTSVTISQPTVLSASSNATAILCNGGSSTVTVTATGGTAPYTGTGTFTVNAGTYTYTVTDANGCSTTTSVTVTEPTALAATSSATAILCNGGSSTITVTATGGTAPYTGTGTFTVNAGTYTYTVTDANGCSTTTSVTVTEPTALAAASNATAILCNGGSSTVTVTATGGTAPYTGTGTFTETAGTYTYTVTDANGCSTTTSVTITEPSALSASSTATAILCNGGTSTVTVTASGGTAPYTGTGTFTETAGTYTYTVTDANGCSTTTSVTITEPSALSAASSATSILCNGGTSTVTVTATGGTAPYTGTGTFTETAGTYTYTVTDANGCSTTTSVTITEPSALSASSTATAILCNGGTSTVTVTATGGTAPYTGTGTFTETAGTYTYTVTDANGCSTTTSVTITEPSALSAASSATAILCNGGSSTVTVIATGGTAPYTGTGTFTETAGTYTYTVTDANGCSTTTSVTITEPTVLDAASSATAILCNGGSSTVTVTATGGTTPYTGTGTFTVTAGTYTYTVTDANGCSTTTSVTVGEPSALSAASNATAILCNGGSSTVTVTATGGTAPYTGTGTFTVTAGTYTYTVTDANGCSTTTSVTITEPTVLDAASSATAILCNGGSSTVTVTATGGTAPYTGTGTFTVTAGTYTYTVTDANGCSTTTSVTVGEPSALSAASNATAILCNGGSSTVTVTATGGTAPYTGTGTFTVTAGTYTYTVTDANGCSTTTSVTITEPSVLSAASSASAILCNGGSSTVTVTATGGTAPYTGTGTFTVTAGTYTYTVTDANGCSTTTSVTISEPTVLAAASSATAILCNGGNSTVTVTATGGTAPYTGTGTFTVNAGTYTYTVTDANGCSTTTSVTVTEPTALAATSNATAILCNGGNSTVTVTATGGTAPYTGTGTFTVTAGTYTYTVTDANGCSTTTSVTITEPTALAAASSATAILCNGGSSTVTVTATGGTAPYNGTGTFTVNAGTYTYTVTDANGCSTTTTVTVGEPAVLAIAPDMVQNATCNGSCNGGVWLTVTGGVTPYTYTINGLAPVSSNQPSANQIDIYSLCAGTYNVTVTDANGCTASTVFTVDEPAVLSASSSATAILCNGGSSTVTVTATGGTAPYTGTGTFTVNAGTYTYTVTDANGCSTTTSVTVGEPTVLAAASSATAILCNGGSSTVTVTATGGTTPYTGTGTFTVTAGTYTYTVTDANGCSTTTSVTVTEPTALAATTTKVEVTCTGGTNGSIDLTAAGGTPTYTYSWYDGATTEDRSNLSAGTYTVKVTDLNGCTAITSAIIGTQYSLPTAQMTLSDDSICVGKFVIANAINAGAGATYAWNFGANAVAPTTSGAGPILAHYTTNGDKVITLTVTSVEGCVNTVSDTVRAVNCASIGDYVWNDTDKDGTQDGTEVGVSGVTVTLYNSANQPVATTKTDAYGNYNFESVFPGNYTVGFTLPVDYVFTSQDATNDNQDSDPNPTTGRTNTVTVVEGVDITNVDAGVYYVAPMVASLGNFVWNDANGNGAQDAGEEGVSDVTVTLYDAANNPVGTTITNANGFYQFTNLTPATYSVGFSLPIGYKFTVQDNTIESKDSDVDTLTGRTAPVTLVAGQNNPDVDAGIIRTSTATASVGDYVFNDLNQNGIQDAGENGIGNVTVNLYDINNVVVGTSTTDAFGYYIFTNLIPGGYAVEFIAPAGYVFSPKEAGADRAEDSDADATSGKSDFFVLIADERKTTVDAGLYLSTPAGTARLGDYVWYDTNNNGVQDGNESGAAGVTAQLFDANTNTLLNTTATNSVGYYSFTNLAAGNYYVVFSNLPQGYQFTTQTTGTANGSDANVANGSTPTVTLAAGQNNPDIDAGIITAPQAPGKASLGDFVWNDLNNNGVQDAGELGVGGVTVTLYAANGTTVLKTTTTVANGYYIFNNLDAGDYVVGFSNLPSGYAFSPANQGGNDNTDSDANTGTGKTSVITLGEGDAVLNVDAGIYNPVATGIIGDFVWNDANGNGVQDPTEVGVAGVTVTLYDATTGNPVTSTVTDANGNYTFTGVPAGTYAVGFSNLPTGFTFTTPNQGGNPNADSDADVTTGISAPFTLTSGQTKNDVDAGLQTTRAAIGNYVWFDNNQNGAQDANEAGVAGVTVTLYNSANNAVGSTITDANGFYYFPNVIPANGYTIGFSTLPANVVFTAKDATTDANDSDVNPATGKTDAFNVAAGEVNYTFDAGIYAPSLASWEGYVWLDVNKNGQQNAGEEPVSGVTVTLYNSANQPVGVTVTDASGAYHFDNLVPSSYYVGFSSLPQNTSLTSQNVGPDATDSDADQTTGNTSPVAVAAGQHVKNEDAGIIPPVGSIGNYVWIDANGNGLQDEPASNGINGLTIQLWNPGANAVAGGGDDVLITSTVTANDGSGNPGYYQFFGLLSGKYFVKFPTSNGSGGLTTATLTAGTNGNSDANTFTGNSPVVTINGFASGLAKDNPTIDAGYVIGQILCPSACFKQDTMLQTVSLPRQKLGIANKVLNINKFNPALGSLAKVEIQARIVIDNKYKVENDDALPAQITLNTNGNGNFKGLGLPTAGINASYNESRDLGILAEGDVFTFAGPDYVEDSLILGDFYSSPVNAALNGFVGTGTIPYTVNANGSFSVNGPSNYFAQVSTYARVELYVRYIYCTSQCAKVGDYVWNDENKDGIQDANEVGIAGATVALYNNVGTLVSTTATDAYGKYTFNDVIPGQYSVGFTAPTGYVLTTQDATTDALDSDPNPTTSKTGIFSVAILDNVTNIDAGYYAAPITTSSLGDFVWNDLNNNGMQETGEPGVANVEVTLYQAGNPINTTTTDVTGKYIFNNVLSGTYEIGFTNLPAGYSFVAKDATEDSKDSDVNAGTGKTDAITVTYGANMSIDAGIYNPNVINRLGDRVWNDANANGIQDATEMGVGGITVTLYNNFNIPVNHALTDGNGNYLFAGVPAGTYTLGINNLPSGFVISPKDATVDANDSDANLDGRTDAFTITSTQVKLDVDFGINEPKATLGNFVWSDDNTNGIQDAGEAGVAGVTVTLYNSSNVAQAIAITNGAGEYCFKNLNAGTYTLGMSTLPLGKGIASKDAGANTQDALDNDFDYTTGKTDAFTLAAGQVNGTLDGGLVQLGAITGTAWSDDDKKGDQSDFEDGISDVRVRLFNSSNVELATTYTDANGNYAFNGLYPDNYYVVFDTITDKAFSFANQVDDAFDSDVNVNNGHAPSSNGINDDFVTITGQIADIDAGYRSKNLFLPIELLSFTGELVNGVDGLLKWTTSRELNSHHFELYRSLDKVAFERVGTDVPAQGNSYTNVDYNSTDKRIDRLKVNIVYYRLKMIDIDGTFKWSDNIVELNLEDAAPITATVYPNPVSNGNLTVEYHLRGIKYADAVITNDLGQAIFAKTITDNGQLLEIDVTKWAKGVYFLKLATETDNATFKVIVE